MAEIGEREGGVFREPAISFEDQTRHDNFGRIRGVEHNSISNVDLTFNANHNVQDLLNVSQYGSFMRNDSASAV